MGTDDGGTAIVYFVVVEDTGTGTKEWRPATGKSPLARVQFEAQRRRAALADSLVASAGFCDQQDGSSVANEQGVYTLMNKRCRLSRWVVKKGQMEMVDDELQKDAEGFTLGAHKGGAWTGGRCIGGKYVLLEVAPAPPPHAKGVLQISATDLHT